MSSSTTASSPFMKAVVGAMRKLYPEKLADSSFDNTGLLLEAPHRPDSRLKNSALLTIDLTKAVADEAIARQDSIVISYHPIIFRGLKSITLNNTQQTSLLRLAQEGISVYSPHTAVDAAPGGLNDWLADIVTNTDRCVADRNPLSHNRQIINPVKDLSSLPPHFSSAGYGRIVTFSETQNLIPIIEHVRVGLGNLRGLSVAIPQHITGASRAEIGIRTVGICAGSGGSMLNGLDVDLLFTGELSHHEALAAVENGRCVITASHSNSERGYLKVMKGLLEAELKGEGQFEVAVSECDRDPFEIITNPGEQMGG
ncbi:uncharacterized protein L3040_008731 [Drepanopeziza brunnea f. sp. 'multigermtubi']|uniref:uncharacterized protein n=1 Tax=Drepanopeziza brunnea f. sp. 'multigermtubi' TaxID=698441 RepID=UPI002387D784|nr:hypothetical protein L3040_008731 [Drepanopeziza brunnea f. sp. 'multigermtubi']